MMLVEYDRLLFCANPVFTPYTNFGFIKKNLFEIFIKKFSWTFSIKLRMENAPVNYTTIFGVEGIDLSFDLDINGNLILRADKNSYLFKTPWLKEKLNTSNIFTLTYNSELKLYTIFVNEVEVGKLDANDDLYELNQIKLCCILRQYSVVDKPNSIELNNVLFAGQIITTDDVKKLFDDNSLIFKEDKYQRLLIEGVSSFDLYGYYNFKNNMYGKVWDNTGNNNFFYTSLPASERFNHSVI